MKSLLLIASMILGANLAQAQNQRVDFNDTLNRIQGTNWTGQFEVNVTEAFKARNPLLKGLWKNLDQHACLGPINVHFFRMAVEEWTNGRPSVGYRHYAFTHALPNVCRQLIAKLSPVPVGKCGFDFPKKQNIEEDGRMVPFRSIIPSEDGATAKINAPACKKDGSGVERHELNLANLDLQENDEKLVVTIELMDPIFKDKLADFSYTLNRINRPLGTADLNPPADDKGDAGILGYF